MANNGHGLGFEATLWQTADKLRNNMDAAEYKQIALKKSDRNSSNQKTIQKIEIATLQVTSQIKGTSQHSTFHKKHDGNSCRTKQNFQK